jgi:hypothetical protein
MNEFEIWLPIHCQANEGATLVCTLFARRTFEVRPMVGERITFLPCPEHPAEFSLRTPIGFMPTNCAGAEVEEISHYPIPNQNDAALKSTLTCAEIVAATISDARQLVAFLCSYGFEVDTYGINVLSNDQDGPGAVA